MRRAVRQFVVVAALCLPAYPLVAQVRPDAHWRTIPTEHFRVHFTPATEPFARRAAVVAERAYGQLARELVPPRGTIDLVISDDVDYSNGYASTFPTNRIVVYAHPPVDALSLRDYGDWGMLVITHELTHVFHLDRVRGPWSALQHVFGRNALLFPAQYEPSWLVEGLAVYYESRLTGVGRLQSSDHRAIARATALGGTFPRLGDLSSASTHFPGGGAVYVYGSLVFEELARAHGDSGVPRFVERSSAQLIPFFLDRTARRSFGESFTDALHAVRDTARAQAGERHSPFPGWRGLAGGFDFAEYPRWRDSSLIVSANTGKETTGAYALGLDGRRRRLGRRVGGGPNSVLGDGSLLFAQLEFDGPFQVRSDLYVQSHGGTRRLTRNARLTQPDARPDGEIVAARIDAGTTQLVRVSRDGSHIWPLTSASLDTQWAEPRWSPAGDRIAAVRIPRGALSEIVVLDSLGALRSVVAREASSVSASPAWSADGREILFTSDRTGVREVYAAPAAPPADSPDVPRRVSDAGTALLFPEPRPLGTGATQRDVAAVLLEGSGYTVGVAPLPAADVAASARGDSAGGTSTRVELPAVAAVATPSRRYAAWRTLVPRYWFPIIDAGNGETRLGAATSANDVVGRHAYVVDAWAGTRGIEQGGTVFYEWAGMANPVLDVSVDQDWDALGAIVDSTNAQLGTLRRRMRTSSASLVWRRQRARNVVALRLGGEYEWRDYAADTRALLGRLPSFYQRTRELPAVTATIAASNAQRPSRSISPEDGLGGHVSVARHWEVRVPGRGYSRVTGAVTGYRSLALPGYAHHVLALRAAGGWTDAKDGTELTIGGSTGDAVAIATTNVGGRREFPLRGYKPGSLGGTRVLGGSLEYRAPAFRPSRGIRFLPVFLDRTSVSVFSDAATAWCPASLVAARRCGSASNPGAPLISAGAELLGETAFPYDAPLLLRLGYGTPIGRVPPGSDDRGIYLSFGFAF